MAHCGPMPFSLGNNYTDVFHSPSSRQKLNVKVSRRGSNKVEIKAGSSDLTCVISIDTFKAKDIACHDHSVLCCAVVSEF